MKRTLIVMRHAKTEAQQAGQKDFDRNLLEQGRKDAALMASRLAALDIKPDLILTSSAARAEQSTRIIKSVLSENIKTRSLASLYLATADTIEHEVLAVEEDIKTLMLIGHNPGISSFAYHCNNRSVSNEMPTAALVIFTFDADNWQCFGSAIKKTAVYDYPKK